MARSDEIYGGAWGRTRTEAIHVSCACGFIFAADVHRSVNVTRDPALGARLRDGNLGQARCPSCAGAVAVEVPVVYHDETRRLLVLVLPSGLRHRELEERADLLYALARDKGFAVPAYVRDFRVVFGAAELASLVAAPGETTGQRKLEERAAELERIAEELARREAELAARGAAPAPDGEVPPEEDPALDHPVAAPIVDKGLYGELPEGAPVPHTVVEESTNRFAVGQGDRPTGGRDAAVARFRATHSQAMHVVDHGEVRLLLRGPMAVASDEAPRVRVGLYRLPSYPLVVVGVGPGEGGGEPTPLFFDVERPDDQQALGILAASFHLVIDAYDDAGEHLGRREAIAPLAANVRAALTLAEEHLAQIPSARRSFDVAVSAFRAPGFDRWGRRDPRLDEESFASLPTPAAAQKALGVVAGWSEPSNEDYLLLVRSFPIEWWRRIRGRVIHRGVELGLVLPGLLLELAVTEGDYRSKKELVTRTLSAFAELVAGRNAQNDLEPEQIAANWRALFILCEEEGVIVDARVAELARQSAAGPVRPPLIVVQPRAGAGKEEAPAFGDLVAAASSLATGGAASSSRAVVRPARSARDETGRIVMPLVGDAAQTTPNPVTAGDDELPGELPPERDLRGESAEELVELLEDKDLRLGAALELARRTDPTSVGPIFAALRRMTRSEAVRVIPAVVKFGERAVPHLCDLLRSRKAYLRQGSALALGILKSGDGIDPLCELLVNEPTEIWKEVARALGEIGGGAVMSLAARLRDPDLAEGDARERITWALAHVVAKGSRAQVETLAGGRDPSAAGAARRALELAGVARDNDAEVRGPLPPHDQTVNRAFSRRFFEALGVAPGRASSEEIELSSGSVSLDEDVDILDADEAVIEEEDILPS